MTASPRRNQPCPCGSGRRYKACCGRLAAPETLQNVPDGILVVPRFLDLARCKALIEIADRQPASDSRIRVETGDGKTTEVVDPARVTQQIDVSDAAEHFIPLVDHVFKEYVNPYYGVETERFEFPQVLKYGPGGKHIQHNDAETPDPETGEWVRRIDRDYSVLVYLNDEFTGGELQFDHFGYTLKPRPGMLVAFPSGHPYEHEARPLLTGLRYVVVSWGTVLGTPRVTPKPVGRVVYTDKRFLPADGSA